MDDRLREQIDALKAEIAARNGQAVLERPGHTHVAEQPQVPPRAKLEPPTKVIESDPGPVIERTPTTDPQIRLGRCDRPQPPRQVWDPHKFGK